MKIRELEESKVSKKDRNKNLSIFESTLDAPATPDILSAIEKSIDNLYKKINVDVSFTNHFKDRLQDPRNGKPITIRELLKIFADGFKKYGSKLKTAPDAFEAVFSDLSTLINVPFIMRWNDKSKDFDLVAKTIMRKDDFKTPDPKLSVESKVFEDAENGKNVIKAWFDSKQNKLYKIKDGYHHSSWLWIYLNKERFEEVYGSSVDEYLASWEYAKQIPPKYDENLLDTFIADGWVRLGYDYDTDPYTYNGEVYHQSEEPTFYANGKDNKTIAKAVREFYSMINKKIENSNPKLIFDTLSQSAKNTVSGDAFYFFLKTGSIKRDLVHEQDFYHGSDSSDDILNKGFLYQYIGKGTDSYGYGFYFIDNKDQAAGYAPKTGKVVRVKLDLKKPIKIDARKGNEFGQYPKITTAQAEKIISLAPNLTDEFGPLNDFVDLSKTPVKVAIKQIAPLYTEQYFSLMNDFYRDNPKEFLENYSKVTGYDGVEVTFDDSKIIVAWFPSQITKITYADIQETLLSESKSAPLYHATSSSNAVSILNNNVIKANTKHELTNGKSFNGVSLTRDKNFSKEFSNIPSREKVVFVLDQQKLAQRYKIMPIDFFVSSSEFSAKTARNLADFEINRRRRGINAEAEEFVLGDIANLDKYLVKIVITREYAEYIGFLKSKKSIITDKKYEKIFSDYETIFENPKTELE